MSESTPAPTPVVDLDEFKTFLKLPPQAGATDDKLLQEVLDAAIAIVGEMVDASLDGGEVTVKVRPNGRNLILPRTHLQSVVSVTDPHGNVVQAAQLDENLLSGIVTVPRTVAGTWTVVVTPREGNAAIKQAVKIIAQHLWGTQRGVNGSGARASAFANPGEDTVAGIGYAIPRRAAELLKPYLYV